MTTTAAVMCEPATGEPATGEPATGEPATGEPATGEPATGEPATIEDWALAFVRSMRLVDKLTPPPRGLALDARPRAPIVIDAPGRPPELRAAVGKQKAPRRGALVHAHKRARLFHGFLHHELQAAELFAWALLAFPDTPLALRRGLAQILRDELRHVEAYRAYLRTLGVEVGEVEVNDWFWRRVPGARDVTGFLAVMGLGFESANLDHAARYVEQLGAVGDAEGAQLQAQIALEERPHVAFAVHWFERLHGPLDFDDWRAALPAPLTPTLMRGRALARDARRAAGWPDDALDALDRWAGAPVTSRSPTT